MELNPVLDEDVSVKDNMWYVVSAVGDRPSLRTGHTASYVPVEGKKGKVVFVGGANPSELFTDVHILDLDEMYWNISTPTGFSSRYEHCCFIPKSYPDRLYVIAGANMESNLVDVQYYNITEDNWTSVKTVGSAPSPRTHFTNATSGDYIYMYSGGKQGAEPVQDRQVYRFDAAHSRWTSLPAKGDLPSPTHGHSLTCIGNEKLISFGGMAGRKLYNDAYIYDIETGVWTKIKPKKRCQPCERAAHTAAVIDNQLYVFGGINKEGMALDDLWKLDLSTYQWTHIQIEGDAPACRLGFASCIMPWAPTIVTDDTSKPAVTRPIEGEEQAAGDSASGATASSEPLADGPIKQQLLLIHGGMDTQGEIFDDCLVYKLS